jgi:hypothetical protein
MIQEVTMYTAVCDNCGEDIGSSQDYSCWNDEVYALENATNSDWIQHEGKLYCPKCYSINDDDAITIHHK